MVALKRKSCDQVDFEKHPLNTLPKGVAVSLHLAVDFTRCSEYNIKWIFITRDPNIDIASLKE